MQRDTVLEATLVAKYVVMAPLLNERTRRLWAAAEFVIPATATTGGKAIPYGIYDLHRNEGWVSVGGHWLRRGRRGLGGHGVGA